MSIQSNSEALQRILQAVNSLPAGGVTVQRKAGSFLVEHYPNDDTMIQATVDCGFVPDVVILKGKAFEGEDGIYYYDMIAVFPEQSADKDHLISGTSGNYAVFEGWIKKTGTGFEMRFWAYDDAWDYVTMEIETFEYVAIKYT